MHNERYKAVDSGPNGETVIARQLTMHQVLTFECPPDSRAVRFEREESVNECPEQQY